MVNTIAQAMNMLEELIAGLDQAYWELSTIERKDFFYDIISAIHSELSEISKLSVQDHDLNYEPITKEFRAIRPKLMRLTQQMDEFILRTVTAHRLEMLIKDVVALPVR